MAWKIQSVTDFYNKIKTSVFSNTKGELQPEKDPFVKAISQALAILQRSCYSTVQDSVDQTFAITATDLSFLKAIAFQDTNNEIQQKQAEYSNGKIVVVGNSGLEIPSGTSFITDDGYTYSTVVTKTCSLQSFTIESLERISNYVVATVNDHELGNLMTVTISGANENDFNGNQEIEILNSNQFRYYNEGVDEAATGTIFGSFTGCRLNLVSDDAGASTIQTFTDAISLASTLDSELTYSGITYDGITGGSDIESIDSFKARVNNFLQKPQNKGNKYQHQSWITNKTDANYAYVYIHEDNLYIYLNCVVSKLNENNYTFTDFTNDELTAMKEYFINNNQLLLGVDALQLSFINPTFVSINISIAELSPNTNDMKLAIESLLREYLSLTSIKKYLTPGLNELSASKIERIISLARDSAGNIPEFGTVTITGSSGLDEDDKKAILGTISYT